jgi:RNA recognition motif. (a.k.a. RRM, RBD, or RNP domain)
LTSNTSAELKTYMKQFGQLHSCLILKDSGKSRGFGFVTFASHDVAIRVAETKAHHLHGKEFGCSLILSNKAAKHKQIDKKNRKVYIKVRDKTKLVHDEVWKIFSEFGAIEDITILQESKERSGFVLYSTKEAVDRLLEVGEIPYKDSVITSEPCLSRKEIDKAKKSGLNTSRAGAMSTQTKNGPVSKSPSQPFTGKILEESESVASSIFVPKPASQELPEKPVQKVTVPNSGINHDYKIKVTNLENSRSGGSGKEGYKKPHLTIGGTSSEHGQEEERHPHQGGFLMIPSVRGENMSHGFDAINSPQSSADEGKKFLMIPAHRDHYPTKRLSEDFNEKDAAAIALLIPRSGSTKDLESKRLTLFPPQMSPKAHHDEAASKSRERDDSSKKSTKKAILSSKASSTHNKDTEEQDPLYKFHRSDQVGVPFGAIGVRRKSHNLEAESPSLMRRLSESNPKAWQALNDPDQFMNDCDTKSANQETRSKPEHAEE